MKYQLHIQTAPGYRAYVTLAAIEAAIRHLRDCLAPDYGPYGPTIQLRKLPTAHQIHALQQEIFPERLRFINPTAARANAIAAASALHPDTTPAQLRRAGFCVAYDTYTHA